ncbi:MAG TPA: glucokinase [Beijerinckiaceae bacterium]|jgi:glucokinase
MPDQRPILIGDIGGTNARFALIDGSAEKTVRGASVLPRCLTVDFPDPLRAIRAALSSQSGPAPGRALLAVATKVEGPVVRLTNAAWTIDAAAIGEGLGLEQVELVNDYVPMAAAAAVLDGSSGDLAWIGEARPSRRGPIVVLGPGTGFGAAALLLAGERRLVQSTEAGHVDLGPADDDEARFWPYLERVEGRITVETVLSGPGLLRLYRAMGALRGVPGECLSSHEIVLRGVSAADPLARDALHAFARLLGRVAGDLALIFSATSVLIGSGIAPSLVSFLKASGLRAAFSNKAPFASVLENIPTGVILEPDPALRGLAVMARDPDRFLYDHALWTDASGNGGQPAG